ncbi:MAG: CPBP family intramembrane glutamic endopeptidase [Saccharofermentanales bacterium]
MKHSLADPDNDSFRHNSFREVPVAYAARDAAGTLLLLHALLAIIMQILKYVVPGSMSSFLNTGITGFVSSALIMQGICILIPAAFVLFYFRVPSSVVPGPASPSGGWIIMSATVGIPAAIVFTGLNNGFVYILTRNGIILPASVIAAPDIAGEPQYYIIIILLSVFLPGIVEELMFRGIIQGSIESAGGRFSAIVLPAAAFAVFHVNLMFIVAPLLAGFLLGYVRYKTGTVYASILTHITMNMTILLMNPLLPQLTSEYVSTMSSNSVLYASLLASLVASVALVPMLLAFSSVKTARRRHLPEVPAFPVDYKYMIGFSILLASMLFYYYTNS